MVQDDQKHCSRAEKDGKTVELVVGNHFECGNSGEREGIKRMRSEAPGDHVSGFVVFCRKELCRKSVLDQMKGFS